MCDPVPIAAILHIGSFPRRVIRNPFRGHCEKLGFEAISPFFSSYFDVLSIDSTWMTSLRKIAFEEP